MPSRGRPVSQESQRAVLTAAAELLDERGYAGFVVDEVARRSQVSKATIYRHWSGGFDLAVAAYGAHVTAAVPVPDTGDPTADLTELVVRIAAFYASPRGRVAAQLLAAGIDVDGGPQLLARAFFGARRDATVALIEGAVSAGVVRKELDPQLVVDLLFGPIVFRLFNGQEPFDERGARVLAAAGLRACRP